MSNLSLGSAPIGDDPTNPILLVSDNDDVSDPIDTTPALMLLDDILFFDVASTDGDSSDEDDSDEEELSLVEEDSI